MQSKVTFSKEDFPAKRGGIRPNAGRHKVHYVEGNVTTVKVVNTRKEFLEKLRDLYYQYDKMEEETIDELIEVVDVWFKKKNKGKS